jgi:hypothetical protein
MFWHESPEPARPEDSVAASWLPGAEIYVGLGAPVLATRTVGAPVSDGAAHR